MSPLKFWLLLVNVMLVKQNFNFYAVIRSKLEFFVLTVTDSYIKFPHSAVSFNSVCCCMHNIITYNISHVYELQLLFEKTVHCTCMCLIA